jgi:putative ABC transport system ATP-binding protein
VLRGVDLVIDVGELVAVEGPSGSGKTTLLNLIGGLDRADQGDVTVDGRDVSTLSERELARMRNEQIGFVFQAFHLLDHLTVGENVALPAWFKPTPDSPQARRDRARTVLDRVGIAEYLDADPTHLSGGQRQRVAIARALYASPVLVLADEPTGNLDTITGAGVLDLFRDLNDEGTAFLIVTHESDTTARAKRIVNIRDGLIVPAGEPPSSGVER